jgi:hypothetical protein
MASLLDILTNAQLKNRYWNNAEYPSTQSDPNGWPVDLKKPVIKNKDGSISTQETMTIEQDGKFYLVPTIISGVRYPSSIAREMFLEGRNNPVGVYTSLEESEKAAIARSRFLGEIYKNIIKQNIQLK